MSSLKNIISFLLTLLGLFNQAEEKAILIENEKIVSFYEHKILPQTQEIKWLSLLYLQEERSEQNRKSFSHHLLELSFSQNFSGELCPKNHSGSYQSDIQIGGNSKSYSENDGLGEVDFHDNPDLVEAWKLIENSARRTDIKTLKFFDDPAVVASRQDIISNKIHETFPDIPVEELTAIRHYSSDAYAGLNDALRKGNLSEEYQVVGGVSSI